MAEQQINTPHRKSREKKETQTGDRNPKAFGFSHPGRYQKQAAHTQDVKEKRLHVPLVDRLPEEAPPLVVGVVGPPQVGKTTLIKSMIRRYTKQTLSTPTGPLTVVTSKRRRLTFIECPSDSLASMIDVAKVVDIVLLMIDGKYGFEMETMEFLNVLSASGMPGNVFGILTKLDLFKKQDTLRAQKKVLKQRFWTELYQGAKLFYLSGVVNGRYPDREILNLSRFLSVMKNPRPLVWRNSHPYCLADRFLDITPPTEIEENPKCDRTIALYGYLRGTNFPSQGARVHIPGVGDLSVSQIESLPDPCPTPYMNKAIEKATGKPFRKRLGEKQRVLFAPMSDVGGVLVDKDAVYIDVKTTTFDRDGSDLENRGLGEQLVIGLQGDKRLLGQGENGMRLFGNATSFQEGGNGEEEEDQENDGGVRLRRPAVDFASTQEQDSDSNQDDQGNVNGAPTTHEDDEFEYATDEESLLSSDSEDINEADSAYVSEDDENPSFQPNYDATGKVQKSYSSRSIKRTKDLARLMYDLTISPKNAIKRWKGEDEEQNLENSNDLLVDNDFFRQKQADEEEDENVVSPSDYEALEEKWNDSEKRARLSFRFTSSRVKAAGDDADTVDEDGEENFDDSSDEGDGEFEDLETGETESGYNAANQATTLEDEREKNARKKEELKMRFEEEDREGFANGKSNEQGEQEFGEDDWYDAQKARIQKQLDINRAEFDDMDDASRIGAEGYKAGTYARIALEKVPYEFAAHFNPRSPIIIGGLNPTENRFGYVQARIKRHRWHQKILKTNDPLIFSLGWRRFQTLPVFSTSDSRTRNRMLKYTPEHMHCFGTFYGPLIAPNTGFCCVQSFSNKMSGFRVAATGVILNVEESTEIVKKLKLTGHPHKIFKNTAILKDMFSSELEVAKFKAGNLRTVSGVRGMIKGRAGKQFPEGYVRAGFEDKILMSDIVFLSTWVQVKPREFYLPVTNLLMSSDVEEKEEWNGMRLTGEVRRTEGVKFPRNKDSEYRPIERPNRHFNPLRVPRKLAADLPFKSQITQMKPQKQPTYTQRRAIVAGGEEKKARDLMQKLMTLRNEKVAKRAAAQERRKEPYRRRVAEDLEKKVAREKREKEEYWRREGKKRKNQEDSAGGVGKKRRK